MRLEETVETLAKQHIRLERACEKEKGKEKWKEKGKEKGQGKEKGKEKCLKMTINISKLTFFDHFLIFYIRKFLVLITVI